MRAWIRAAVLLVGIGPVAHALAADPVDLTIGYVQMKKDARYSRKRTYARYLTGALGRPYSGARVAIDEAKFIGSSMGLRFVTKREKVKDAADAVAKIVAMHEQGVRYFILDAPADVVASVAEKTRERPMALLNISARDDGLRAQHCQPHLLHVIPSHAMLADALAQYLVFKKWREVLMLVGASEDDVAIAQAFKRSAKRMGLKIVDERPYVLSNDPRERDRNNVALLTSGEEYDVVYVADSNGEFSRDVPYHVLRPRPVVGSEGLAAAAWHWAWERHGAPQLEGRFQKRAKRPMRDVDWAAWMSVKAVVEAVQRTGGAQFDKVVKYMRGQEIILDGFKGNRVNFRPWDGQLRQPILLVTHNWVVDRAPIKGFLHPTNNLDTLGFDERDQQCQPK